MREYNTIEEALEELRQGRMILVTDDPDNPRQRAHLHAHERRTGQKAHAAPDGF